MRHNVAQEHRNITWLGMLFVVPALAALLLVAPDGRGSAASSAAEAASPVEAEPALQVPPRPWTAVGSTGVVDEASLNIFAATGPELGFKAANSGTVLVARYNVTNTFDNNANPNGPGWTRLEMGSTAPINTIIEARLFQVKACDSTQTLICTARNRSMDSPCARCTLSVPVDFTSHLYYIEVTITRQGAPAAMPRVSTLRLF